MKIIHLAFLLALPMASGQLFATVDQAGDQGIYTAATDYLQVEIFEDRAVVTFSERTDEYRGFQLSAYDGENLFSINCRFGETLEGSMVDECFTDYGSASGPRPNDTLTRHEWADASLTVMAKPPVNMTIVEVWAFSNIGFESETANARSGFLPADDDRWDANFVWRGVNEDLFIKPFEPEPGNNETQSTPASVGILALALALLSRR